MHIEIVKTVNGPQQIMDADSARLDQLSQINRPVLHLYRFECPSITYGHFIPIEKMLNLEALKEEKIALGKRPTGGGVIFHLYDLAFSFLMPSTHPAFSNVTLENYAFVNEIVKKSLTPFLSSDSLKFLPHDPSDPSPAGHFCMAKPTIFDVMHGDKKIAGAAQRKKKQGYLHQGSIAIQAPSMQLLNKVLVDSSIVAPKMEAYSHYFFDNAEDPQAIDRFKQIVELQLISCFEQEVARY